MAGQPHEAWQTSRNPYATPDGGGGWPPAPPPASNASVAAGKGFVASLFDFSFTHFVAPKIIRVLYALLAVLVGLGALGLLVEGFAISVVAGLLVLVIIDPLVILISLAFYRVTLEIFMVIFRIHEDLRAIRERGDI